METNPIPQAIPLLDRAYDALFEMMYVELTGQTTLKGVLGKVTYAWDARAQRVKADATGAVTAVVDAYATNQAHGTDYDARNLQVLEELKGEDLVQANADSGRAETDPLPQGTPRLNRAYGALYRFQPANVEGRMVA